MLAGWAFCEMLPQYPQSASQGVSGVASGGQQQFATQTLRVHLLGIESPSQKPALSFLVDVSIFFVLLRFFIENPRRGGGSPGDGGRARGAGGCLQ